MVDACLSWMDARVVMDGRWMDVGEGGRAWGLARGLREERAVGGR